MMERILRRITSKVLSAVIIFSLTVVGTAYAATDTAPISISETVELGNQGSYGTAYVGQENLLKPAYSFKNCKVKVAKKDKKNAIVKKKGGNIYLLPLNQANNVELNWSAKDSGAHGRKNTFKWTTSVNIVDKDRLSATKVTMGTGKTYTLSYISGVSGNGTATFKSSKKKIASVDKNTGLITAKSTGEAEIKVTYKKKYPIVGGTKKFTKTCKVVVTGSGDPVTEGGSDGDGGDDGGDDNGGGGGDTEDIRLSETLITLKNVGDYVDIFLYDKNGNTLPVSTYGHTFSGLSEADCVSVNKTPSGNGIRVSALNNGEAEYFVEYGGKRYSGTVLCLIGAGQLHLTEYHIYLKKDDDHNTQDLWLVDEDGDIISVDDFDSYEFTRADYSVYDCITLTKAEDGVGMTATAVTPGEGTINVNYNGTCYSAMVTVLSDGSDDDDDDGGGGNLEPNEEGYIEIGPLNFYYDKDYTSTDNKTNLRIQFAGEADSDEFGIIDNWKASPNTKLQSWGSGLIADISDLPAGRDSIYIKGTYKGIKYQFNANIVATPGMFHDSIYDFDPATGKFNYRDNTVDLGAVPAIISMREYAPNPYFPDETVETGDCSVYITMYNYDFKPDRWTYNNLSDGQQTIKEGVDVIGTSCTDDSYCASNVSVWVDGTTYSFVISPTKEDDQFQQKSCTNVRINAKDGSWEYKYDNHMISW